MDRLPERYRKNSGRGTGNACLDQLRDEPLAASAVDARSLLVAGSRLSPEMTGAPTQRHSASVRTSTSTISGLSLSGFRHDIPCITHIDESIGCPTPPRWLSAQVIERGMPADKVRAGRILPKKPDCPIRAADRRRPRTLRKALRTIDRHITECIRAARLSLKTAETRDKPERSGGQGLSNRDRARIRELIAIG